MGGISIRVLVVAGVRLYRDGLTETLGSRKAFVVVGAAAERVSARASAKALKPDVVIVDMAVREALDLIRDIRGEPSGAAVIAFAVDEVTSEIIDCAEAGAASYVTADASIDDLAAAIEGAVTGELLCSPRIAGELFRRLGGRRARSSGLSLPFLTSRERQVLEQVRLGLSNKEISHELRLAESTVKNHVHHLLSKLNVRTRVQAAARAVGRRKVSAHGSSESAAT